MKNENFIIKKLSNYNKENVKTLFQKDKNTDPIFRVLSKDNYANQFAQGQELRITTLKACRIMENEAARDVNEGKLNAKITSLHIDSTYNHDNHDHLENLKMMGIHIENSSNITLHNINSQLTLDNAYILCTTTEVTNYHRKNYGEYIVRIDYPNLFAYIIFENLKKQYHLNNYIINKVNYGNQTADITNSILSSHLAFEKTENFSKEKEFRMLFLSHSHNIEPIKITIPELSFLCTKIY